jgi:hypothetical protein
VAFGATPLPCLFERSEKSPCGRERLKRGPLASLGVTKKERARGDKKGSARGEKKGEGSGRQKGALGAPKGEAFGAPKGEAFGAPKGEAFGATPLPCLFERSEKSPPCGRERLKRGPLASVRGDKRGRSGRQKRGTRGDKRGRSGRQKRGTRGDKKGSVRGDKKRGLGAIKKGEALRDLIPLIFYL